MGVIQCADHDLVVERPLHLLQLMYWEMGRNGAPCCSARYGDNTQKYLKQDVQHLRLLGSQPVQSLIVGVFSISLERDQDVQYMNECNEVKCTKFCLLLGRDVVDFTLYYTCIRVNYPTIIFFLLPKQTSQSCVYVVYHWWYNIYDKPRFSSQQKDVNKL